MDAQMDQQTEIDLDQIDEEILTCTVSDEALEVAARTERGAYFYSERGAWSLRQPCGCI
jgi:hypothetical protein